MQEVDPITQLLEAHHVANIVTDQLKALSDQFDPENMAAKMDPTLLAHGLICEAMQMLLGVPLSRADLLARGFIALAVADQARADQDEKTVILSRMITGGLKGNPGLDAEVLQLNRDHRERLLRGTSVIPPLP